MVSLLVGLLLTQTQSVRIVNPLNGKTATTTTSGAHEALDVNCVGCTTVLQLDGGSLTVNEGIGPDGGIWSVYVMNPSSGGGGGGPSYVNAVIDGGAIGVLQFQSRDGGVDWAAQSKIWDGTNQASVSASNALKTDSSATTQPISAAALPLPTGASTEATLATIPVAQASTTSGQSGPLAQGATTTAAPTYVTAKTNPLSLTTSGNLRVDGSSVTQPVSAASLPLPAGASTAAKQPAIGTAGSASADVLTVQGAASMTALKVDGSGVTQPISGTVTANAGTNLNTSALALDATLTSRAQKTQITDGTRDGTVKAASTAAGATDTALVVAVSPNNSVAITAGSLPLPAGAATAAKQPALGTAGSASADVITVQGAASMTALKVDGSGVTQPISGSVTANAGTNLNTSALALDTTLTAGTQKAIARGGAKGATAAADVTSTANGADHQALDVSINGTATISGSVTANAGTNLNTSALQLDATGAALNLGQASTTAGQTGPLVQGATTTAAPTYVTAKTNPLSLTTAGGLRTDGSGTTQPISAASLPLPTGASTAAKQPALGTAGSASADVISVQGVASMTALKVDGSGVTQPISGSVTANAGTNLNTSALALDATLTSRSQKTQLTDGTRDGTVKAANTAAGATDTALVVAVSPNNSVAITAAALPLPSGAATEATLATRAASSTQTDRSQKSQITDGTRDGTVKAASTAAGATDTSLVVGLSPNSPLPAGSNAIGHVVADTGSTTAVTGSVTVVQPTGTNLHAVIDATSTTAVTQATGTNLHAVIDTGSTTAVTGNVTVVQPTGTNLHTVVDSAPTTAVTNAGLTNLDVALSTRTKPADQQHTIIDSSATIPVTLTSTTITGTSANNITQFGGTNVSTGTGTGGAGIPRVTVSSDSTVGIAAGAAVIGSLAANQSVNVAQVNGVTVSTGNGAAGTGVQRVVLPGVAPSISIPGAQTPVLVGGSDDNGQAQFVKTDTTGHVYTVPLANQQYDQFQATLTTTGFDVVTNIPSGTVGININIAGPVSGGSMVISIQDVASDDTSQVLGPITTGPTITTAGTYQFTATTRSNAIRVTHTITGVSSFAGTSISVVSHLGNDVDKMAALETANGATLTSLLDVQQRELYRIRALLEAMLEQMLQQTDIQSKIH